MTLRLVLVRHGQTAHSVGGEMCGCRTDVSLTPRGYEMAHQLGEAVNGKSVTAIFTSPLSRAYATALPASQKLGLPLRVAEGLREMDYGEWEGKLPSEVDAADYKRWHEARAEVAPPGGESGRQVLDRARAAIESIQSEFAGGTVIAVSHRTTIRVLICDFLGIPLNDYRRRVECVECSATVVDWHSTGPILIAHGLTPEGLRRFL